MKWQYEPGTDIASLAAAYAFGLTRNHPFVDGNKRTGFMALFTSALLNGWLLEAPNAEVVSTMLALAAGGLSESSLADWVRNRLVPAPA